MSPEKEKSFKDHINRETRKFKRQMIKLAIENDYPYVTAILESALNKMKKNIELGRCDCRFNEYGLISWNKD